VKRLACIAASLILAASSCRSPSSSPYRSSAPADRNTVEAEELTREAADLIDSDLEEAEALLRRALAADIFFGPAHNNLGVVFLKRKMLYEAANELEWARKLMPGHPDPKLNLAITLEQAGRGEEAIAEYTAALEVYPGYLPAIQGLARAAVRDGREEARLEAWRRRIALESPEPGWSAWGRAKLGHAGGD